MNNTIHKQNQETNKMRRLSDTTSDSSDTIDLSDQLMREIFGCPDETTKSQQIQEPDKINKTEPTKDKPSNIFMCMSCKKLFTIDPLKQPRRSERIKKLQPIKYY